MLSGLILTLALFSGIAFYVSQQADFVLNEIYQDTDTIDFVIDTGLTDPIEFSQLLNTRSEGQNPQLHTIEPTVLGAYSWYVDGINWHWIEDGGGSVYSLPNQGITRLISTTDKFYDFFQDLIQLKAGTWDLEPQSQENTSNQTFSVVVTETFLQKEMIPEDQKKVGGEFFTWSWVYCKDGIKAGPGAPVNVTRALPLMQDNAVRYCRIAGIIDSNSTLFNKDVFAPILDYGGFFSSVKLIPFPLFYRVTFRWAPGYVKAFDLLNFGNFKASSLDKEQPMSTLQAITSDKENINSLLSQKNNNETYSKYEDVIRARYHSINSEDLEQLLKEYIYWKQAALTKFLIFSSPVIFLGIYILSFSGKHTINARASELSSLKSRGLSNAQILQMLLTENMVTSLIATPLSLFSGSVLSRILDEDFNIDKLFDELISFLLNYNLVEISVMFFTGFLVITIFTLIPAYNILAMEVEDIATQEISLSETISEKKRFWYYLKLLGIGVFFAVGLPTTGISALDNMFITILGILAIIIILISGISIMSQVASHVLRYIDQLINQNIGQLYLLARELKRLQKRSSAAFIVLSLTMAFGIISGGFISTASNYYARDAQFQLGSDIRLDIKSTSTKTTAGDMTCQYLNNDTIYPEVDHATSLYVDTGYLVGKKENLPSDDKFLIKEKWIKDRESFTLVFINSTTFSRVAYLQDYFVGTTSKSIAKTFDVMGSNYNNTCIISQDLSQQFNYNLKNNIKFTSGFYYPEHVFHGNAAILATWNYFPPALSEKFIIVDYRMIDYQNTRFNSTTFKGFGVARPVSTILVKIHESYKDENQEWGTNILFKLLNDHTHVIGISEGSSQTLQALVSQENRELTTLLRLARLDFYYALLVSAIGFLLVLEIKTSEKKSDFGILKAIGFGNRETFNLVLLDGLVSIISASVAGVLIGSLTAIIMIFLFLPVLTVPKIYTIAPEFILTQFILGTVGAIIGVLIPAYLTKRFTIDELIRSK